MHIKKQALMTRQTPMQKALSFGENALKVVGTVKGVYDLKKKKCIIQLKQLHRMLNPRLA